MRIPQSVIRSIMEGPLQPSDPSKRHPDMQPQSAFDKKVLEAIHRTNPLMPNLTASVENANIQDDIETMASASPKVKYVTAGEQNIKRASASSKSKKERKEAVENSRASIGTYASSKMMNPNAVRSIISDETPDTSLTMGFNGGLSMIHDAGQQRPDSHITDVSRQANRERKLRIAERYAGMDRSDEAADVRYEQQKARTLKSVHDAADQNRFTCASSFGSCNQYAPDMPKSRFDEAYISVFKSKMPEFSGLPKDMKKMASLIKNYQMEKLKANYQGMSRTGQQELEIRLQAAKQKADQLVEREEKNRKRIAGSKIPTVKSLTTALNHTVIVEDVKADTIQSANKKAKKLQAKRDIKDGLQKRASVSKPSQSVVDRMIEIFEADRD